MPDLLCVTMNVTITVEYFETFCISQESEHIKTIIVRNTAIMFYLSVKKVESLQKYNNSVYSPTEKLAPVNNNTSLLL